jgi:hypothetical protein
VRAEFRLGLLVALAVQPAYSQTPPAPRADRCRADRCRAGRHERTIRPGTGDSVGAIGRRQRSFA